MEINFIQMCASVGHAVAYTIGPIFTDIIITIRLGLQASSFGRFCSNPSGADQACQQNCE